MDVDNETNEDQWILMGNKWRPVDINGKQMKTSGYWQWNKWRPVDINGKQMKTSGY